MPPLPLEDNFNDILGKAARGQKLTEQDLAAQCGVPREQIGAVLQGEFNESVIRRLAPILHLDPEAVVAIGAKTYAPKPVELEGLAQFTTPWDDMMVNNYLVWDPASREAVAFDSGADSTPLLTLAEQKGLRVSLVLLTHTHGDHIFDLDRLKETTGAPAYVGEREPIEGAEPFPAGRTYSVGALQIETRLTWGHSKGGITYVVRGLSKPVAVVGDAVFAGSMGGGMISYPDALETNRREIFSLPDETILCSGHGPLTTVGEEKRHNPFFAGTI
jgi:hydroxyacylglutathione hydrolase